MAVAKRQGREKPPKIEQRKVRGLERGPRVGQRAVLAGPVHTGQAGVGAAGGGKHIKRGAKGPGLSLLVFGVGMPSCLKDVFSCYFLNKTEL